MNFDEAMSYIDSSKILGSKLGLHNISYLMKLLGNPEDKLKFVHIAGTNGKGSTSAYINNILIKGGYKTGLFTSPHIERFSERMLINNVEITNDQVGPLCEKIKSKIDIMLEEGMERPTEFEIITAMAILYFVEQKCDIVVFEVGLGGRLDATNVIKSPLISAITTIDYDHTTELGRSLAEIANEKAGIIKQNGIVVSYEQHEEAARVIEKVCKEKNATLYIPDFSSIEITNFEIPVLSKDCNKIPKYTQCFNYKQAKDFKISLLGKHQVKNAVLSISIAEQLNNLGLKITEIAIREGLEATTWSGRFEVLRVNPLLLIDGAHNPQGAKALGQNLEDYFPNKKMLFVVGVLSDKDYDEMLAPMLKNASRFFTVTPDSPRALTAEELANILRKKNATATSFGSIRDAIEKAISDVQEDEVICCFGSLYFIGEARAIVNENTASIKEN